VRLTGCDLHADTLYGLLRQASWEQYIRIVVDKRDRSGEGYLVLRELPSPMRHYPLLKGTHINVNLFGGASAVIGIEVNLFEQADGVTSRGDNKRGFDRGGTAAESGEAPGSIHTRESR
jgi:hypothetical protein